MSIVDERIAFHVIRQSMHARIDRGEPVTVVVDGGIIHSYTQAGDSFVGDDGKFSPKWRLFSRGGANCWESDRYSAESAHDDIDKASGFILDGYGKRE